MPAMLVVMQLRKTYEVVNLNSKVYEHDYFHKHGSEGKENVDCVFGY
jgi:hypothetical protein